MLVSEQIEEDEEDEEDEETEETEETIDETPESEIEEKQEVKPEGTPTGILDLLEDELLPDSELSSSPDSYTGPVFSETSAILETPIITKEEDKNEEIKEQQEIKEIKEATEETTEETNIDDFSEQTGETDDEDSPLETYTGDDMSETSSMDETRFELKDTEPNKYFCKEYSNECENKSINKCWKDLSREFHPDKNPANPELALKKTQDLNMLYDELDEIHQESINKEKIDFAVNTCEDLENIDSSIVKPKMDTLAIKDVPENIPEPTLNFTYNSEELYSNKSIIIPPQLMSILV